MQFNVTEEQKKQIIGILISAFIAILGVLGVLQVGTTFQGSEARVREKISIDARDDALLYNGASLIVYSDDHVTQKAKIFGSNGDINAAGVLTASSLVVGGVAQSGAVRYGTATSVVTGTLIAHGLGVTPTSVVVSAQGIFTQTVGILATNATSFTVAFGTAQAGTVTTLNWMAGK